MAKSQEVHFEPRGSAKVRGRKRSSTVSKPPSTPQASSEDADIIDVTTLCDDHSVIEKEFNSQGTSRSSPARDQYVETDSCPDTVSLQSAFLDHSPNSVADIPKSLKIKQGKRFYQMMSTKKNLSMALQSEEETNAISTSKLVKQSKSVAGGSAKKSKQSVVNPAKRKAFMKNFRDNNLKAAIASLPEIEQPDSCSDPNEEFADDIDSDNLEEQDASIQQGPRWRSTQFTAKKSKKVRTVSSSSENEDTTSNDKQVSSPEENDDDDDDDDYDDEYDKFDPMSNLDGKDTASKEPFFIDPTGNIQVSDELIPYKDLGDMNPELINNSRTWDKEENENFLDLMSKAHTLPVAGKKKKHKWKIFAAKLQDMGTRRNNVQCEAHVS